MTMKSDGITCPVGKDDCTYLHRLVHLEEEIERLKRRLDTDELTGLHTYAYLTDALTVEMERTRRTGAPTTLIMMDLDHFKRINDELGHEAGNLVLREVGGLIKKNVRTLDIPCRYGGEEFVIIQPSTSLRQGLQLGERLRCLLKEHSFIYRGTRIEVTASLGVNTYTSTSLWDLNEFVHATDTYLYKAKKGGRDRVESPMPEALMETEVTQDERQALFGGGN